MCSRRAASAGATTTINLAAALAPSRTPGPGRRLRPPGCRLSGLAQPARTDRTVYNLLMGVTRTSTTSCAARPQATCCPRTSTYLVRRQHRPRVRPGTLLRRPRRLRRRALVDCQPSLGLLTVNALTASRGVIIPLECEFFALRGVALLIETIEKGRTASTRTSRSTASSRRCTTPARSTRVRSWPACTRRSATLLRTRSHRPHRQVPGHDRRRRADHHLRPDAGAAAYHGNRVRLVARGDAA